MQKTANCARSVMAILRKAKGCGQIRWHITKTLLVMKLTIVLLTVFLLQVHARGVSQKVTLSGKNMELEQVLSVVKKQTGFIFFYDMALLKGTVPVTITAHELPMEAFLKEVFKKQPLDYTIRNKTIVISLKPGRQPEDPLLNDQSLFLPVTGSVHDVAGNPLVGATVRVKGKAINALTDGLGGFSLTANAGDILVISFVGFTSREYKVTGAAMINLTLERAENSMDTSVIVNTGYQSLPKERATGSFVQIDNAALNRRVSVDIISRLEDQVPGLVFNRAATNGDYQTQISIRGKSTINAKADPLIVIDNFPYEGSINNINPNDVQSITVLKDAAAASIWGARAGNGVIVITTKKGQYQRKAEVTFNSNVTIGNKPDLFYVPVLKVPDFIDIEISRFNKALYADYETADDHPALSPVVELLIAKRDHLISDAEADAQINAFKQLDNRNDLSKYFYQKSIDQQYALNVSGGGENQRYFLSGGYDQNRSSSRGNTYNRISLNASNTYAFINRKLEFTSGIYLVKSNPTSNFTDPENAYPYVALADASGKPLPIINSYRKSFVDAAPVNNLLNWEYNPLEEARLSDNETNSTDYRILTGLKYKITPALSVEVIYQYRHNSTEIRDLHELAAYFTRDLINNYTQINPDGSLVHNIPLGDILDRNTLESNDHNLREQINFSKNWGARHSLSAIGGFEVRDLNTNGFSSRQYGYDHEHAINQPVDYTSTFPQYYYNAYNNSIPYMDNETDLTDRYRSYFANAAYTYLRRYTVSASGRVDQTNLFGVETNQKGVPLYSAGAAWNIDQERFFSMRNWLSLKLRMTYGYNGNVYKNTSAYTTAQYNPSDIYSYSRLPYAQILNPPNPELRWERVKIVNMAIDFNIRQGLLEGSIEYYRKNGIDLIGKSPFPHSTGIQSFTGNNANTKGHGVDLSLTSQVLNRAFRWQAAFIMSYAEDKVTRYLAKETTLTGYLSPFSTSPPTIGRPLFSIYSYRTAGLDPLTGDPRGYLNGNISKEYSKIASATKADSLVFNGSARPIFSGAFRNTFQYKNFSLSVSVSYRLNYYFRRVSLKASSILNGFGGHGDYYKRWQKPGDELFTQVPSMPATNNASRDNFYTYSGALIEKGDHIRLQDVNLSYNLPAPLAKRWGMKQLQGYVYANNLGLIWKATHQDLDPDYNSGPPPYTIAAGIRLGF